MKFQKGNKNGGRKLGSRNRLSAAFVDALAADFEKHGDGVIAILRVESPSDYCRLIGSLVPKELGVEVSNKQNELREWLSWMHDPKILAAMEPKAVEQKAPELPMLPSRPRPMPRPRHEPFNASEAARAEPLLRRLAPEQRSPPG